ncbi:MAG: chemoreceptor glutamine deamidase CheD [Methylophilaceae bacterium]|uniref:chemoreceptor glutamine deamidase CheD n=1 Tax=Methylovorus sp. MM2 TaxID=1848038 RepID=UPI0007DFE5D3|nr:chemoreceptor glutamine deamidase CheD [Methylovorus sp. MM2]OAM51298.1 chemotaxis protein CheD [Methylovorus sp. MM2]
MATSIEEQFATNLYFDKTFNCEAAKILPGEYYTTDKDMVIVTVLGSCVSACIRDKISGIGGMNHFMLPDGGVDPDSVVSESMRYGTYAMEILINQLLKGGARRENLEAKIFGGGNVLQGFTAINVGEKNAQFVRKYLKNENIRVMGEDLNDVYPRKVYFFPKTGRVLVKKLKQMNNYTVVQREKSYADKLQTNTVAGDVELF